MDPTLWRNEEAKFKPVNKQAALICRKATGWHLPPEEEPAPKFALTAKQQAELESKQRQERIAAIEAETAHKKWKQEQQRAESKMERAQIRQWKKDGTSRMVLKALKRIAKQTGAPMPTTAQVQKTVLALPAKAKL